MYKISKSCSICQKLFLARPTDIKRGFAKFCSRACSHTARKGKTKNKPHNRTCATCKKTFYRSQGRSRGKSTFYFCSRACKDEAQTVNSPFAIKEIMPPHFNVNSESRYDYRSVCFRYYNYSCLRCGYNKIPEIIHVHHKDQNRANNVISNLEPLCPNCHAEEHFERRKNGGEYRARTDDSTLQESCFPN